jgi:hypothetical protein
VSWMLRLATAAALGVDAAILSAVGFVVHRSR